MLLSAFRFTWTFATLLLYPLLSEPSPWLYICTLRFLYRPLLFQKTLGSLYTGAVVPLGQWLFSLRNCKCPETSELGTSSQHLRRSGFNVATTCSHQNFDLVRRFGADFVIDYVCEMYQSQIKSYLTYITARSPMRTKSQRNYFRQPHVSSRYDCHP